MATKRTTTIIAMVVFCLVIFMVTEVSYVENLCFPLTFKIDFDTNTRQHTPSRVLSKYSRERLQGLLKGDRGFDSCSAENIDVWMQSKGYHGAGWEFLPILWASNTQALIRTGRDF